MILIVAALHLSRDFAVIEPAGNTGPAASMGWSGVSLLTTLVELSIEIPYLLFRIRAAFQQRQEGAGSRPLSV